MKRQLNPSGFTLVELLVVLVLIAVLASLFLPVIFKPRHPARQATCNSNVRQLATAVQMYVQDNHSRFPGKAIAKNGTTSWEDALLTYVGSKKIYFCPSDAFADKDAAPISYGYNGLLVNLDGSGLKEAQVKQPTEVGAICDASTTKKWGYGGLVGGGAFCDDQITVKPEPRHGGVIVGFCDGHAKYQPGKKLNLKNTSSLVTRSFYMANALGLVDNPAGGMRAFTLPKTAKQPIVIGGDYCTYPLLTAAAELWTKKTGSPYFTRGFLGQFAAPKGDNYAWGCADGTVPQGNAIAIARDALVVIVSKHSKILRPGTREAFLGEQERSPFTNNAYVVAPAEISRFFDARVTGGSAPGQWQVYTYNAQSGNRRYFERVVAPGVQPGKNAIVVENDGDMVDQVAADPYGIGYCSSVLADLDRVQVLAIRQGSRVFYFPSDNIKYRWELKDKPNWPYMRTLYAVAGNKANTFARLMLAPGGPGTRALQAGPLFQASYLLPK